MCLPLGIKVTATWHKSDSQKTNSYKSKGEAYKEKEMAAVDALERWTRDMDIGPLRQYVRAYVIDKQAEPTAAEGWDLLDEDILVATIPLLGSMCPKFVSGACSFASPEVRGALTILQSAHVAEAGADGTCLFHSFLACVSQTARRIMGTSQRMEVGVYMRKSMAVDTAEEAYTTLRRTEGHATDFPRDEFGIAGSGALKYEANLFDEAFYAQEGMVAHLGWLFKVNIFCVQQIYENDGSGGCGINADMPFPFDVKQPCIALLNMHSARGGGHYRPICFPNKQWMFSTSSPIYTQCFKPLVNCQFGY